MPDNLIRSIHTLGIPQGATLRELLADRETTQKEFAVQVDLSEKYVRLPEQFKQAYGMKPC